MASTIRFLSLNVGMRSDLAGLRSMIKSHKPDVIFLQEVKFSSEEISSSLNNIGFKCKVNNADDDLKPGTALLWRNALPITEVFNVVTGRAQLAVMGDYVLLNVYAPSGSNLRHERELFFGQDIFRALALYPRTKCLLFGDFNCIISPQDVEHGIGFNQKKCPSLSDLLRFKNLTDVYRHLHPSKIEFTFFRPHVAASRLDRVYVAAELLIDVYTVQHIASLSDHFGVLMVMSLDVLKVRTFSPRNRSTYWKLNCSILDDEDFSTNFSDFWPILQKEQDDFEDIALWWDERAKPAIKEFCMEFSVLRSQRLRDTKRFLFAYLKVAQEDKNWKEVLRVKQELAALLNNDAYGHLVRSRNMSNASVEKASIFHANTEMKNSVKNSLFNLKIEGEVQNDPSLIENEVVTFFNALFNGYHDSNLINTGMPFCPDFSHLSMFLDPLEKLSDIDRDELEQEMSLDELEYVLKNSSNNKSPGLDGLSYELYKSTWSTIKHDLLRVFNCQLQKKSMICSNREGVTRLVPKVDGVPSVDELRPITLLNCDYKLLAKWFVMRLKPKLPLIIKSGQLCTVGKRNILFGVSNVLSSILTVKQMKSKACLINLDFFKAYDRVMLSFLLKVMEAMNFGAGYLSWISMLHEGARTRFILSFLTCSIEVNFSIRQGDPLAMLLYIIYVEPLLVVLERKLTGIVLPNVREVLEAYCDDLNVMTDDLNDFGKLATTVEHFEIVSGAILSRNKKCKALGIGNWADREEWPLPWLKTVKSVKVFGIFVSNSYRDIISSNWSFRIGKFRQIVMSWSARRLDTLYSRIEVLRSFALSRIYYVASILPLRKADVKQIESIMGQFIWKGRVLRVAFEEMKNNYLEGGLYLPCIWTMNRSLLSSQCLRLLNSGDQKAIAHLDYWLGPILHDVFPDLGLGEMARNTPEYFMSMGESIADLQICDLLSSSSSNCLTNKMIYLELGKFPIPKIAVDMPLINYKLVWRRLNLVSSVLSLQESECIYLLVNNKLPTPERLHRIGMRIHPFCNKCPGIMSDISHFFCSCSTDEVWGWIRDRINRMCNIVHCSDWEVLNFLFPETNKEKEIGWLIGSYAAYVWKASKDGGDMNVEKLFGYLTFKYRETGATAIGYIENFNI